jgi:hypothetical protein
VQPGPDAGPDGPQGAAQSCLELSLAVRLHVEPADPPSTSCDVSRPAAARPRAPRRVPRGACADRGLGPAGVGGGRAASARLERPASPEGLFFYAGLT